MLLRMALMATSQTDSSITRIRNSSVTEIWQHDWDEYPRNKYLQIIPKLNECLPPCCSNRKEETFLSQVLTFLSYVITLFVFKVLSDFEKFKIDEAKVCPCVFVCVCVCPSKAIPRKLLNKSHQTWHGSCLRHDRRDTFSFALI